MKFYGGYELEEWGVLCSVEENLVNEDEWFINIEDWVGDGGEDDKEIGWEKNGWEVKSMLIKKLWVS